MASLKTQTLDTAFNALVDQIRMRANLDRLEATGFYAVNCPICKKMDRKTGGFKFEPESIIYNCFKGSCDASTVYELGKPISRKFRKLMEAIGVEIPIELKMIRSTFQKQLESLDETLYKKHSYSDIEFDECFELLSESSHPNRFFYVEYFESRMIPWHDVIIFTTGQYRGLAAIPFAFYDKLIGVQVITLQGKYIKLFFKNTNVIYLPESKVPDTVLVVEGALDAKCFTNTVATLGSKITPEQAFFLRGKDVIMIPEKKGNNFINQFHQYGWKMSIPEWGDDCKDLNDAVMKYGVIVVAQMVKDGIVKDKLTAQVRYKDWIKGFKQ